MAFLSPSSNIEIVVARTSFGTTKSYSISNPAYRRHYRRPNRPLPHRLC